MKKYCLLTLLFCLSINGISQRNFNWGQNIDGLFPWQVETSPDNNIIVFAEPSDTVVMDFGNGLDTIHPFMTPTASFILKFDPDGNLLWGRHLFGLGSPSNLKTICFDPFDNVIIVGGYSDSVDFDPGPAEAWHYTDNVDMFCLKLDANGDFVWVKTFVGTYSDALVSVTVDDNGNILAGGYYRDSLYVYGSNDTLIYNTVQYNDQNGILFKINQTGEVIWSYEYGSDGGSNAVSSIDFDQNMDIYFQGVFHYDVDFDPGPGLCMQSAGSGVQVCMVKLSSAGDFVWCKSAVSQSTASPIKVRVGSDGNPVFMGTYKNILDLDPGVDSFMVQSIFISQDDRYLQKLDANGDFIWGGTFGKGNNLSASFDLTPNDFILISGDFIDTVDVDPGPSVYNLYAGPLLGDSFIAELTPNGDLIWASQSGSDPGIGTLSRFVVDDSDRVVGTTYMGYQDYELGFGGSSPTFNCVEQCGNVFQLGRPLFLNTLTQPNSEISIHPNPSKGYVMINCEINSDPAEIEVYDLNGWLILQKSNIQCPYQLELPGNSGMYVLKIRAGDFSYIKKLVRL